MEIELQYVVEGEDLPVVPVVLAGFPLVESRTFDVVDTYYDTEACDLRRAGCVLRVRTSADLLTPELSWKRSASRRPDGAKERLEETVLVERRPESGSELEESLRRSGLWEDLAETVEGREAPELHVVGELRATRSVHKYEQGLLSLELSWDRVHYPVGPDETRLEVEASSEQSARFLEQADEELRGIFGDRLRTPKVGKVRQLHERLYPDLLDVV